MRHLLKDSSLKACFLMALSGSCIIAGYEFIRSPSNALIKEAYGMTVFTTALAFMPFAVFAVLYLYGKLLDRFSAQKTLVITQVGSAAIIALCIVLLKLGIKEGNLALLIFREAYIVLVIEQLWSFINNTIDTSMARKVNGAFLALSSLGGICADVVTVQYAQVIGTQNILIFCILAFIPAIFFSVLAYRTTPKPASSYKSAILKKKNKKEEKRGLSDSLGFSLFKTEPVLFVILFVIIASQTYSTAINVNFQSTLLEHIPNVDEQTAYSGKLFFWLHCLSLSFQLILVPLVLNFISLKHVHFLVPAFNLVAIIIAFLYPSLETVSFAFLLFKSLDYSLFRAAKEILYIPLSFDAKFRSKELIDVLGYRASKGLSASALSLGQKLGGAISTTTYSLIGAISIVAWMAFIFPITRKQGQKQELD